MSNSILVPRSKTASAKNPKRMIGGTIRLYHESYLFPATAKRRSPETPTATRAKPTPRSPRRKGGRRIADADVPLYARCEELYCNVEAGKSKMAKAVMMILREYGDYALGGTGILKDQKRRLRYYANQYRALLR
jgi:hypothetical protein